MFHYKMCEITGEAHALLISLRWFDINWLNYLFKLFIHMEQIVTVLITANICTIVYNNNVSLDTFHSIACKNQRYTLVLQMLPTYLQQTIETFPSKGGDWISLNANLLSMAKLGAEFPIATNATSNMKNIIKNLILILLLYAIRLKNQSRLNDFSTEHLYGLWTTDQSQAFLFQVVKEWKHS